MTVHAPGWRPVVQYPVAEPSAAQPVSLDAVGRRLGALAHPVRLRLVRTLARGSHTTGELALAWDLTPPEVSRHLAVLRRAGLLTAERRRRYVHYAVDLAALTWGRTCWRRCCGRGRPSPACPARRWHVVVVS